MLEKVLKKHPDFHNFNVSYQHNVYNRFLKDPRENPGEFRKKFSGKKPEKKKIEGVMIKGGYWKMPESYLELLKINQNKTMLYLFLHNHIWTSSSKHDKHNIHYRYYVMRNLLATSWGEETLSEYFNVDVRTIKRWIQLLRDDGVIITEFDKQHNNNLVFILGEYDDDGYIIYYGH